MVSNYSFDASPSEYKKYVINSSTLCYFELSFLYEIQYYNQSLLYKTGIWEKNKMINKTKLQCKITQYEAGATWNTPEEQ